MRIEIFVRRSIFGKRRFYFRLVADNGEPVAQSEGYSNRADCAATAMLIRAKSFDAEIHFVGNAT